MKKLIALIAMAGAALFTAAPAYAEGSGQSEGTIPIVFQLTLHGHVPEGESFYLFTDPGGEVPAGFFCSTKPGTVGPACQDSKTYTVKIPVPADEPITFSYVLSPASGPLQTIESHSKVFAPGEIVTAEYTVSGEDPAGDPPGSTSSYPASSDPASGAASSTASASSAASTTAAADQYSSGQSAPSSPAPSGPSGIAALPDTGGALPVVALSAALLIGGGLLVRRIFR